MTRLGGASPLRPLLALGALAAVFPAAAHAQSPDAVASAASFAPGEVLVRYEPGTTGAERADVRQEVGGRVERRLLLPRAELLELGRGVSVNAAVAELERQEGVAFAEPNFVYRLAAGPNDPDFLDGTQWNLDNTGFPLGGTAGADVSALEAWDDGTNVGSDEIVVAIVDSGVALDHPDLDDNLWVNTTEAEGVPSVDDEPNGYVDDVNGWDWVGDDADPSDEEGHGTHVAGIVGAEGNNGTGVAGVNWDVSLMALRACDRAGACLNADMTDAFEYAAEYGAEVVNASISGASFSQMQKLAMASAPGTLFVAAAGNDGNDNDASPRYPCSYDVFNLICVAATTDDDELAGFSNFGRDSVDLAAPGGGSPGAAVFSSYALASPMNQTFTTAFAGPTFLASGWTTGGTHNGWKRTTEPSPLPGATLTDSEGGHYSNGTDSFARFGPVNLSDYDAGDRCHLRYDLALDAPPPDHLTVEVSTDDSSYDVIQDIEGTVQGKFTPGLNPYAGSETVYVKFRLRSNATVTGDGAHIDNVRMRCLDNGYAFLQGTSMASPHVAGAAALALSVNPTATVAELRDWLIDGVDLKDSLAGSVRAGGRLNLARVVAGANGEDIDRPETTIIGGPASSSTSRSATLSFVADEPATFRCSLNGGAFGACFSPRTLSQLALGTHTFRVKAVDLAGNVDASPAGYSFTVQADPLPAYCAQLRKQLRKQLRRVKAAKKRAASLSARKKLRKKQKKIKRRIRRDCVPAGL